MQLNTIGNAGRVQCLFCVPSKTDNHHLYLVDIEPARADNSGDTILNTYGLNLLKKRPKTVIHGSLLPPRYNQPTTASLPASRVDIQRDCMQHVSGCAQHEKAGAR
jgi:hypothetical protein